MMGSPTEKELEDVYDDSALSWVKSQNLRAQLELEAHPAFKKNK